MCTTVVAIGQIGVWRATQLEYASADNLVLDEMAMEDSAFQPEAHDFIIVEVCQSITQTPLAACMHNDNYARVQVLLYI